MKNFIFICLKPGIVQDIESLEKQDNSFVVIFTREGQIPDRNHYETSQSVEITRDTVLNARTIKDGFLDSPIHRIKIKVKIEKVDETQNNAMLHPDMMIRPLANTNSEEKFMFDDNDEFDFLSNDFVSYNG